MGDPRQRVRELWARRKRRRVLEAIGAYMVWGTDGDREGSIFALEFRDYLLREFGVPQRRKPGELIPPGSGYERYPIAHERLGGALGALEGRPINFRLGPPELPAIAVGSGELGAFFSRETDEGPAWQLLAPPCSLVLRESEIVAAYAAGTGDGAMILLELHYGLSVEITPAASGS